mmetsp:Transcript_53880/g.109830  ORF Transcript_53880/g.109830 Transcript_53880/m.109830 type:complete len:254 (+) Transcript_53880:116-877(+)
MASYTPPTESTLYTDRTWAVLAIWPCHLCHVGPRGLQQARRDDLDFLDGTVHLAGGVVLDLAHNRERLVVKHLAEDNVLAIEPGSGDGGDEELGAVGVGACVCHGQLSGLHVRELEVLVLKLGSVDALAAPAVSTGEVAALEHEVGDDTVELAALISETWLSSAELLEVLYSLGDFFIVKTHLDGTRRLSTDGHVEVHLGSNSSGSTLLLASATTEQVAKHPSLSHGFDGRSPTRSRQWKSGAATEAKASTDR